MFHQQAPQSENQPPKQRKFRNHQPPPDSDCYSSDDICRIFGISKPTLRRKVKNGFFRPLAGFRINRFPKNQIHLILNGPSQAK